MNDIHAKIQRFQRTGCQDTATELLQHFQPLLKLVVGKMSRNRPDLYEDLHQVAQISLLRLVQSFDADKGIPFEAYAMKSLIGQLKNYLRDKSWYIQVPRRIKEKGLTIQKVIDELHMILERSPNMEEIAEAVGLSVEETIEVLVGRECYQYVSLDSPVSNEEAGATIGDMIGTGADDYRALETRLDLQEAMQRLQKEERTVLRLAFQQDLSQRHIARMVGISQMSVSRIQQRALRKLRQWLADEESREAGR